MATPLTQSILDTDPDLQNYIRTSNPNAGVNEQYQRAVSVLAPLLQQKGYSIPDGMAIDPKTGQLGPMGGGFNPLLAAATLGGPVAASLAGSGFGALAGTAAKAASAGATGTGAQTGMASNSGSASSGSGATKALAILGGLLAGKLAGNSNTQNPQLAQYAQMGLDRAQAQNPLFQAANQGMYAMLPNFARQGNPGLGPQIRPTMPTAQSNGGGMPSWLMPLLAGAGGFALSDLVHGKTPFASVIQAISNIGKNKTPNVPTNIPGGSAASSPNDATPLWSDPENPNGGHNTYPLPGANGIPPFDPGWGQEINIQPMPDVITGTPLGDY